MADTTFADIKTAVLFNLGRTGDSDAIAQLPLWAKMSMQDIMNWRDGWFMQAIVDFLTVVGVQQYSLPSDYKDGGHMVIVKTDKYVELEGPIDEVEAIRRFVPDGSGEPVAWSQDDVSGKFKVWPVSPDAAYTLRFNYMRYLAELSADGDTNTLTLFYSSLLIDKMTAYGRKWLDQWESAAQWEASAEKKMADLHANYVSRVMGRDFFMYARTDRYGHSQQARGTGAYIILK